MMNRTEQKKKNSWNRIILGVLIFLAVLVCWKITTSYGESREENKACIWMKNNRLEEAVRAFENLRQRTGSLERKERIRLYLADCYLRLAQKTENDEDRSLGYYARLSMLAPEKVPDEIRIRLNQKH